jgi:Protein of unknown function (DUF3108)
MKAVKNNLSETLSLADRLHLRTNYSRNPSFMIPFEKNGRSKNMRLFICASIIFLTINGAAQSNAQCIVENHAFNVGEKITYKIAYNWHALWLTAGEASFTVDQATLANRPCYHVTGYGYSYKGYDWFYKVRDTYESYIDMQTMQPLKFVRNIYEDGFTLYQNVTFQHDEHKAVSLKTTIDIPECMQDVLSAIYYARNIDFSKYNYNDTIPLSLYIDDRVFPIYIRYLGKETINTKEGTFNCVKFRPLLISGSIFKGGEKMTVWVTDDENKIPIRVQSAIVVGSIIADMIEADGVRNPMTAKVN